MARRFVWTYNPLMATKTLMTVEQFLQSPEYLAERTAEGDPPQYELDEGEMIEISSATVRHNYTRRQILVPLTVFLGQTELGEAFDETDIRLDSNTLYKPDIVYWDAQHAATIDPSRIPVEVIPQFVVEVETLPARSREATPATSEIHLRLRYAVPRVQKPGSPGDRR